MVQGSDVIKIKQFLNKIFELLLISGFLFQTWSIKYKILINEREVRIYCRMRVNDDRYSPLKSSISENSDQIENQN
jgi:hypothetical protein